MRYTQLLNALRFAGSISGQKDFYGRKWIPEAAQQWQLEQFNAQWPSIIRDIPHFRRLHLQHNLPKRFSSWKEFKETMPVMEKKSLQTDNGAFIHREKPPDCWRKTGGSTAEPLQIPAWNSERSFAAQDMWYARSWFGIKPSDKLFLIWGHRHLLGKGFRGWLNGIARSFQDFLLGYYRYSAYDLSEKGLQKAAQILLEFRPSYVMGYAVALDQFAGINRVHRAAFRKLRLKAVIATAESFPRADSREFIADVFGCPVVMEYGAVETGPLAHQQRGGNYFVFWRHYFLEGIKSQHSPNGYELLVTTLYPRCLPLIRYRIGDLVAADSDRGEFGENFKEVIGRCNDFLTLRDGSVVHSEAFTHAVVEAPSITAYQVKQVEEGGITLNYVSEKTVAFSEINDIRQRLRRINPELTEIRIERVGLLDQTIAGKTRRIYRENQNR